MKLIYEADLNGDYSEIEGIHNIFDLLLINEKYSILKSVLKSDGEVPEISIHDSEKKCRICGCDWFHACPGGCYWVKDDLCSACAEKLENDLLSSEENGNCASCEYGEDIECATVYECKLTGERHYAGDTCFEYCEFEDK